MPIPRPPQAVTFDCWSTLLADQDWKETMRVRERRLAALAERMGVTLSEEQAHELIEASWQVHVAAWRRGEMFGARGGARWIIDRIARSPGDGAIDVEALASELAAAIEEATQEVGTKEVVGASKMLADLRAAGIATALICDTGFTPGHHVRSFLDRHGIRLDHYFFSDEVGTPKPYPRIFEAALTATGASPHQAVHVGDLRRTDIAGARAAGMATIRFAGVHDDGWGTEDSEGEEADAVIHRWEELPSLIGLKRTVR